MTHLMPLRHGSVQSPTFELASPFPPVPRMTDAQRHSMALLAKNAITMSAAATPLLLSRLDGQPMRQHLATCCNRSGIASWSATRLLAELRHRASQAELIHNFDSSNFETDMTIEILAHNATTYFPTLWPLRWLGYYGPMRTGWGHPQSPEKYASCHLNTAQTPSASFLVAPTHPVPHMLTG